MAPFKGDREILRICKVLSPKYWTEEGPTPESTKLMEQDGGPMSSGERVMFLLSWVLWKSPYDPTKLKASDIIGNLDDQNTRLIGTLLLALAGPSGSIEEWILENDGVDG